MATFRRAPRRTQKNPLWIKKIAGERGGEPLGQAAPNRD